MSPIRDYEEMKLLYAQKCVEAEEANERAAGIGYERRMLVAQVDSLEATVLAQDKAMVRLRSEVEELKDKLDRYESAARNPGDGERHRGVSIATQLVHTQLMREKAETEIESLREALEEVRAGFIAEEGERAWRVNFPKAEALLRGGNHGTSP